MQMGYSQLLQGGCLRVFRMVSVSCVANSLPLSPAVSLCELVG